MKPIPFEDLDENYDVVIAGAGPAGAATAGYMSNKLSVLLIDRNSFPRDKPCGGILKEDALEFLRGFDIPNDVFVEPKKLNLRYLDWDNYVEAKQNRYLLNVSRVKFDEWILSLIGEYVDYSDRTELIDVTGQNNYVSLAVEKNNLVKEINCRYLIGASGASSSIRKLVTKKVPTNSYIAIQEWVKNVDGIEDFLYIFDREITDFYSWIIPKGNLLLIGSAFSSKGGFGREKFELLKKKIETKIGVSGPIHKKEAALLIKPKSLDEICLGNHHVLLIGEEAGLISPTSAEGISFALKSGYNCARAINNMDNVLEAYKKSCAEIVENLENKLKKAELLFNPERRLELFKSGKLANGSL